MQLVTYISDSPLKSSSQSQVIPFEKAIDIWNTPRNHCSQPVVSSAPGPVRNLALDPRLPYFDHSQPSSQPTYCSFNDWAHGDDVDLKLLRTTNVLFSVASSNFTNFSQLSNGSAPRRPLHSQLDQVRDSQISSESPHVFTPPRPQKVDKECQTEDFTNVLKSNKGLLKSCLDEMLNQPAFAEMVGLIYKELHTLNDDQRVKKLQNFCVRNDDPREENSRDASQIGEHDIFDDKLKTYTTITDLSGPTFQRYYNKRPSDGQNAPSTAKIPKFQKICDKFSIEKR
ncbi:unnamed protein product [Caenorhabditis bovis]|uniref:Uncharacterized protein n=1 Tax=Caenorhabditis bovis TaxID=2654633 RepID=A0A8S1ESX6_9PELO|nr:unnamed protein product [Caenorhabditis bovis]